MFIRGNTKTLDTTGKLWTLLLSPQRFKKLSMNGGTSFWTIDLSVGSDFIPIDL